MLFVEIWHGGNPGGSLHHAFVRAAAGETIIMLIHPNGWSHKMKSASAEANRHDCFQPENDSVLHVALYFGMKCLSLSD